MEYRAVAEALVSFARAHGAPESRASIERLVFEVLLGERALLVAEREGIVVRDEVVDALLDRFHVAAFGPGAGPPAEAFSALRVGLHRILRGVPGGVPIDADRRG
jgi:hypothetical protein